MSDNVLMIGILPNRRFRRSAIARSKSGEAGFIAHQAGISRSAQFCELPFAIFFWRQAIMKSIMFRSTMLSAVLAAVPLAGSAATVSAQDTAFATKAAQAGMTEVKLAAIAMQKSKNPQVLSFAREMNADHSKANAQLTSIVKSKGLNPPSGVGMKNQTLMGELQAQSGAAFDSHYLKSQLPAHQEVLALFQTEAANGKDSDLVAFAKATIPVIQSHIAMDKRDIAKIGSVGMQMPAKP